MKKILNLILCLGVFINNFLFIVPAVKAEEILEINSLVQNEQEIELKDGVYEINDINNIYVNYTIKNYDNNKNYYLERVVNGSKSGEDIKSAIYTETYNGKDWYLFLDTKNALNNVVYNLYEKPNGSSEDEYRLIASQNMMIKVNFYDEANPLNSTLILEELYQNNEAVTPVLEGNNYVFKVNNLQNVTFKLRGENLKDDLIYPIIINYNGYLAHNYTGAELKKGVEFETSINDFDRLILSLKFNMYDYNVGLKYKVNDELYDVSFNMINDEKVTNYNPSLIYKNSSQNIYFDGNYYTVSNKYHDEFNPLAILINGNNFIDKDYNVTLNITRGEEKVYQKEVMVNGLELNNKYTLNLDDFTSSNIKKYTDEDAYSIKININGVEKEIIYLYTFLEKPATISSELFYESGQKNLSSFMGDGGYYYSSSTYETNNDAFNKYTNLYIRYLGNDFDESLNYTYELYYNNLNDDYDILNSDLITSGSVNGRDLNRNGLTFKVDNHGNYNTPEYRLVIKYNDEIIFYCDPILRLQDYPVFANVSLSNGNNKNLYLKMDDYKYVATRNFPIKIYINGIGFNDNEIYKVKIKSSFIDFNGNYEDLVETYEFSGKQLNKGNAMVHINKKLTNITTAYIEVSYDNGFGSALGFFDIDFVDSKAYFPKNTNYVIDSFQDLIKNVKNQTKISNFANNIGLDAENKIQVYDTTGTILQTNYVGTGMIARVTDSYNNSLLDLDIVVKGDVSGDGNISITDLVKTKQHLEGINNLDGVYALAGDVLDTGSISADDMTMIGNDVAGLESVN